MTNGPQDVQDVTAIETQEWLDSLEWVIQHGGPERVAQLLRDLETHARRKGVPLDFTATTPYINTIPPEQQGPFPGSREIERRIKSLVRWNAMAMVVRANKNSDGIGGHISTFASSATLYEIGFNHFFKGPDHPEGGDLVFFQGHASPGMYARAFLEGRLTQQHLEHFRRELAEGGGLSSYPHPWLMPNFWQVPTVSMGLGPIMAIYQARFWRYLEARGLKKATSNKVWAFLGDGETDEPETLGALTLASRERLDNLIFVINCNLQRLDGPVRGNGSIIQELEGAFRGAGWNVIKVIWGTEWDDLLARDKSGLLARRMSEIVDGEYQRLSVSDGAYMRKAFFGKYPEVLELVKHLSDDQLKKLRLGGHDPEKVFAAYKAATETKGKPTVILARTIKGYGLGETGEGKNPTHQQKKLNEQEVLTFRTRFNIPLSDDDVVKMPFYKPAEDSAEMTYMQQRREQLGGPLPQRRTDAGPLELRGLDETFDEFHQGSEGRALSTTMAFVRMLTKLLRDKEIGKLVVPIVPDEARTFGMEALFRQVGIYSALGQLYEPIDSDQLLYYKEARDGQILEEGITEAGSMSSFIAAGTAYATHAINTIPFYIYYSMFGFQRVGDLIWAAGDMRARGFLLGGTAGRTTLNGEGLQHQDGHSHLVASSVPNCIAYDPAFAYEIAVIIKEGLRRMYREQESVFYYLTLMNGNYPMPPMPAGVETGILKGLYKYQASGLKKAKAKAQLLGSGAILPEVINAAAMLEKYGVAADVWSVTSYVELQRDCQAADRWNMLHPGESPKTSWVQDQLQGLPGVVVAASDYVKLLPNGIDHHIDQPMISLGTDGFGRSESREALRDHFEVDARHVAAATLSLLAREKQIDLKVAQAAFQELGINPDKVDPARA
jgi:pyruvate dehydrogenase E1 component